MRSEAIMIVKRLLESTVSLNWTFGEDKSAIGNTIVPSLIPSKEKLNISDKSSTTTVAITIDHKSPFMLSVFAAMSNKLQSNTTSLHNTLITKM
jgi:chlorite dismutase